jgi:hypothetical protein
MEEEGDEAIVGAKMVGSTKRESLTNIMLLDL